jgi:hypothetical protein
MKKDRVREVVVNGTRVVGEVSKFTPPSRENPWWGFLTKEGDVIYATGDVMVTIEDRGELKWQK